MSSQHTTEQNRKIKTDNKPFESYKNYRYLEKKTTNVNYIFDRSKYRVNGS